MSLPNNFGLLALSPTIRTNDAFLFLQTGVAGYIDMFIQSATGSPVNIMTITSGVPIANTVYVNTNGNDNNGERGSISRPFATVEAALNAATAGDVVEVFPGSYYATGNLHKDGVNYYFHRKSFLELQNSGRIEVPALTATSFKINGFLNLSNTSSTTYPINIQGPDCLIEFNSINLDLASALISGESAGVLFRANNENELTDRKFYGNKLEVLDVTSSAFENSDFEFNTVNIRSKEGFNGVKFTDCILTSHATITSPTVYNFTGKVVMDNCLIGAPTRFIATGSAYHEVKNTKLTAGITVSGSGYYEDCVFEPSNTNKFVNNSLITNMGGNSVFKNCYARNNKNTSYVNYTYIKSGSVTGSENFNIVGSFTSFRNTGEGTTINYGAFVYDTNFK